MIIKNKLNKVKNEKIITDKSLNESVISFGVCSLWALYWLVVVHVDHLLEDIQWLKQELLEKG
jgi:hypothetical protein